MKTVAIIAPQFAPCSYPPAIRVRFFTNHLEEFGWKPVVLSVKPEFMEEPEDPAFARLIPPTLEVIRVKALPPRLTRKLGLGDLGIRCFPYMLNALRRLCRQQPIDAVLIPGPPWHTFCLGSLIKREFGIPYVIDYIDPWVTPGRFSPLTKAFWYRMTAHLLEPWVLRHSDKIIAVSEGAFRTLQERFPYLNRADFAEIPYGCEEADFSCAETDHQISPFLEGRDGKIHFCYVGVIWPAAYETVEALLDALSLLRKRQPLLFKRIELHFFGTSYQPGANPQVLPFAKKRGLSNVSEHPDRIPYLEAITVLKRADVLLALGSNQPHYTPSKIFPCVLAERPILALLHEESSAVALMRHLKVGTSVTFGQSSPVQTKASEICEALIEVVEKARVPVPSVPLEQFRPYSAHSMTQKLAAVLNSAVDPRPDAGDLASDKYDGRYSAQG
jgi:Glycosyl transferase 4-like domain